MKRKEAFKRKAEFSVVDNMYGRAEATRWYRHYDKEQLDYLWYHKYIQWSKERYRGESYNEEYIEFTKKGQRWHNYYTTPFGQWLYYYVFKFWMIKHYWQKFRIACGHRYDWQEYDAYTLDEI